MATRMQQRRGTSAQWTSANPVLAAGEIGFETDTNQFKMGDGVNTWTNLTYFVDEDSVSGSLGDYVELALLGVADGVATLDSNGFVPASQLDIDVTSDINAAIAALVDAAPATLDTLNELAAAIGDDANFVTTVTNSLATKQDIVSGVSDTEIGYLDGVTSSIQTQINSKISLSQTIENKSANYTLQSVDSGKLMTNSAAITITVQGLSSGQQVDFLQTGADAITFAAGSGITLNSKDSKLSTSAQGSPVSVKCISSTVYWLVGDLA